MQNQNVNCQQLKLIEKTGKDIKFKHQSTVKFTTSTSFGI